MRYALIWLVAICACGRAWSQDVRQPPPAVEQVQAATKLIADVYKKEYGEAKTPAQKQALARRLLEDGLTTKDDPAVKFALLQVARKMAVGVGDVGVALETVDAQGNAFAVDVANLQVQVVRDVVPLAKSADDHYSAARIMMRLWPSVLAAERYDEAKELATLALKAAAGAKNPDLQQQWTRRQKVLTEAAESHEKSTAALATLQVKPTDANANAAVGKHYCYILTDWPRGLTMLALGSDAPLQALAERELKGTVAQADQLSLADAWYDLAQKREGIEKVALLEHAGKQYQRLLPALSVLAKRRLEQRLDEIHAATSPFVKDEWVEILDYVDLSKHLVENKWTRQGLAIVTASPEHCKMFKIPVIAEGSYELRVRAARLSGDHGLMVSLSRSANDVEFWLNSLNGGSGLQLVDGKLAHENKSKADAIALVNGRPFTLRIQITERDDSVGVNVSVDNRSYVRWAGPAASLSSELKEWRNAIYIRSCHDMTVVYSVQFKLKSGRAWITE
jgi:hypothetical protein